MVTSAHSLRPMCHQVWSRCVFHGKVTLTFSIVLYCFYIIFKGMFLCSAVSNPQDCLKRVTLYSLTDLFNGTVSGLVCFSQTVHGYIIYTRSVVCYTQYCINNYEKMISWHLMILLISCEVTYDAISSSHSY